MKQYGFWCDCREFYFPVIAVIVIIVLVFTGFAGVIMKVTVGAEIAKIEQLRQDSLRVNLQASEDIEGQVTQANQKIKEAQWYNRRWWSCWIVPNEWDCVELITVK